MRPTAERRAPAADEAAQGVAEKGQAQNGEDGDLDLAGLPTGEGSQGLLRKSWWGEGSEEPTSGA
ncbi:hypothetical protein GCM10022247_53740 [Allokutzneria multivorans]|uniref:Uncharacterized protein n=1 Tax=Allokutzneria multivorans TaxID=1142134 RepID=A0ABP7TAL8_9PSEU